MRYVPLNLKTEYSLLSSLIKIPDLIHFAKKNHIDTLTITDNNMFGVMEFYEACIQNEIKPIIGLDIILEEKHIVLYCMNQEGYHNLIKLSTIVSERNVVLSDLEKYSAGLLAIVPFSSMELIDVLNKIYQYVFRGYSSMEERSSYYGDHCVYMKEIRYFNSDDDKYLTILNDIRDGLVIRDNKVKDTAKEFVLPEDVKKRFPDDLENNTKIIELCHVTIETGGNLLPIYECPDGVDSYSYLKQLCITGLKEKFGSQVGVKYRDRLKYELDVINRMGFCNYFLVVYDYVKFAKTHDILVGPGRGSAAGSLVSYLLNITTIDPIEYDLLFERFLNPERVSMPDIDIDFEDTKRYQVIDYCISKYGLKKVAGIITFSTLKSKQVIRDVGRVLEIDIPIIDKVTKMLDARLDLITNYQTNPKLKEYLNGNSELMKLYKISLELENLKRQTSIHAAGIVMCKTNLDDIIPLNKNTDNFYTTGYSMEYLERLGLLKMDFLAISNLSLIHRVIDQIKKDGIDITFDTIPNNDKEAIQIFTDVNTEGIFQFESAGMKNFLRKFKPNSFDEVAAAIALFRPGPMENIDTFIKRKRGLEKVEYIDASLEPILKSTFGIIVYQEQIMQIAVTMAGYTLAEADILRKAMSKKKESVLLKEQERFVEQSIKRGYSREVATNTYNSILKFASYGFNKSHSVVYAMVAYRMAYLKAHYPKYFMASLLSNAIGSSTKTKEYIYESKLNHIDILKPDINFSTKNYKIEEIGIRYPLSNIKNVGESAIRLILAEREKGTFQDVYDFVSRTYGKGVNRKTIESLIDAGCFDNLGYNKKTLHENLDLIINYGEITKDVDPTYVDKPELAIVKEFTKHELMEKELEIFGFYLSNHPITEYKLKIKGIVALSELPKYFDKVVDTILYVDKVKLIETKKKDKMCFITGSDEVASIDVVLFPRVYQKYTNIEVGDILKVNAKVEKRFDKLQLVVNQITILEQNEKEDYRV